MANSLNVTKLRYGLLQNAGGGGGGTRYIRKVGMLVENFEFDP